jgi:hypothetical protein
VLQGQAAALSSMPRNKEPLSAAGPGISLKNETRKGGDGVCKAEDSVCKAEDGVCKAKDGVCPVLENGCAVIQVLALLLQQYGHGCGRTCRCATESQSNACHEINYE